jgi:hypothetical protein
MKKVLSIILILFLISGNFISCRKDKGFPHTLPSADVMLIDFSNFINTSQAVGKNFGAKEALGYNWAFAAERVSFWIDINKALSVPVDAYKIATAPKASQTADNKWEWNYNANIAGATYKVRLTAEATKSDIKWEMYISDNSSSSEFKVLEGTSNTKGSEGKWTFYESPPSPTALLQIDWTKSGTQIGKIKYTCLKNGVNKDSYIEYGQSDGSYSYYYTVHSYYDKFDKMSDVDIEWNASGEGRVKSSDYLDGLWQL